MRHLPKQKLHPFDLKPDELLEIKQFFPEFKPKRSTTRTTTKVNGLEISKLKEILTGRIKVSGKGMDDLIAKLDHKNDKKITWTEFLNFLTSEGLRREVVNDA